MYGFSAAVGSKRRFQTPSRWIEFSRFWWESTTFSSDLNWWDLEKPETFKDSGWRRKVLLLLRKFSVALTVLWRVIASLLFGPGFALLPLSHGKGGISVQVRVDNHAFNVAEVANSIIPLEEQHVQSSGRTDYEPLTAVHTIQTTAYRTIMNLF